MQLPNGQKRAALSDGRATLSGIEGDVLDGQERFHAHRWRARGAISVTMERLDARTVSRTTISVTSRGIELRYDPMDASPPYVVQAS